MLAYINYILNRILCVITLVERNLSRQDTGTTCLRRRRVFIEPVFLLLQYSNFMAARYNISVKVMEFYY